MRAFAALPVPPDVVRELERIIRLLKEEYGRLKTVRGAGLHLTLQFFGEIDEAQAARIARAMDDPSLGPPSIEAALGGCGQFPPRGNPRVIWCGIGRGAGEIAAYRERFCALTAGLGFPLEPRDRGFSPHVTLARNSVERVRPGFAESLPSPRTPFRLDRLVLFQSTLSPAGASYRVLREVK